jgi:hypothetical protein
MMFFLVFLITKLIKIETDVQPFNIHKSFEKMMRKLFMWFLKIIFVGLVFIINEIYHDFFLDFLITELIKNETDVKLFNIHKSFYVSLPKWMCKLFLWLL